MSRLFRFPSLNCDIEGGSNVGCSFLQNGRNQLSTFSAAVAQLFESFPARDWRSIAHEEN